jgi:hypothetical protein
MFVTNHVLSGVLIGRLMKRRPVVAFLIGLGSHLVLDAIPHWGCDPEEPGAPEQYLRIAKRDGLLGIAVMIGAAVSVEKQARVANVAAMAGAVLLDLDKPCEYFFGTNPFPKLVQRLHNVVQNESPSRIPNEIAYGIIFGATDIVVTAVQRESGRWRSPDGHRPLRRTCERSAAGRKTRI